MDRLNGSNLDGSNVTTIVKAGGIWTGKQLVLDKKNGKLYWSDREGLRVMRANLDGSALETLVETGRGDEARKDPRNWCVGIAVDVAGGKIYWTQKGGEQQDEQHRKKQDEIGKLRQECLAEIIDEADDDAADEGAEQAAGSAKDYHHKRERQHVLVEARIDRQNRSADDPRKGGKTGAEREDDCEKLRDADPNHARHVRVVDAGTDHGAEPRALEQKPQADSHNDRDHDDRQSIIRKYQYTNPGETGQLGGRCDRQRIAAPDHQAEVGGHERQSERHQHLRHLIAGEAAQKQSLGQCARHGDRKRGQQCCQPEIQLHAQHADDEGGADIGAEHEQRAVRQVRNTHQPEDQRETC